jgi:O-antigen biosynthesis protein
MISSILSNSVKNRILNIGSMLDISVIPDRVPVEWICDGLDPQCELQLRGRGISGWCLFEFSAVVKRGKINKPKLYFDSGQGYSESETEAIKGRHGFWKSLIYLPETVKRIRFDPTENAEASFEMSGLSLAKVGFIPLLLKVYQALRKKSVSTFSLKYLLKAALIIFRNDPVEISGLLSEYDHIDDPFFYQDWINRYDTYTETDLQHFREKQAGWAYRPLISVLLPVYNTPIAWLKECIHSVIDQVYDNWELCIADDNSTDEEVREVIRKYASEYPKIKYSFRETNGHIAIASNTALAMATGEFVSFLDHDDKLAPLAFYRIAEALNSDRSTDMFYSDEDKIDENNRRSLPFFKPDWSPTLFYAQNYITHLACIRLRLLLEVGGFTDGLQGSQDYDLFLKVILAGASIKHIPHILYHWRLHKASTSMESSAKPYAHTAGKMALEKHLSKKYAARFIGVDDGQYMFTYLPRFAFDKQNKISIIIPTKDKISYLKPCIDSILGKSSWTNYEIVILDNNSEEELSFEYFRQIQEKHSNIKVVDAPLEFNWSKLNNLGYKYSNGEFLIFLNNDITIITPDWMERLCECAGLDDIASVGASLLYEDDTLQHSGVIVGMNGWADHVFKGMYVSHFPSPYLSNEVPHNNLAVTGACLAIERSKFVKLGMFDEAFIICGSDVEFGIRAHKAGLYNAVLSNVKLYHYESKSRGTHVPENDFIQSALKYEPFRTQLTDPFFNPNLSLAHTSPVCKP